MLVFDLLSYGAFLKLISWDKVLLTKDEFKALMSIGKNFCYHWDGTKWIFKEEE